MEYDGTVEYILQFIHPGSYVGIGLLSGVCSGEWHWFFSPLGLPITDYHRLGGIEKFIANSSGSWKSNNTRT